jgi:hypothetical protein
MIHPPTVVAVDDTPHELDAIISALRQLDVACLPILAKGTALNLAAPLSGVRLIFFDINYLPGVTTQIVRFEVAATILKKVIALDNGPYTLITWTSKPDEHQAFMEFLAGHVEDVPAPAVTACLAKERFLVDGPNAGSGASGGPSLGDAISEIVARQPQINALLQWELSARRAAGEVVNSLLSLFTRQQRFTNGYGTQLEGLIAHVATCAVGSDNIATDRRAAINEAFAPILFDRMIHGTAALGEAELWTKALTLSRGLTGPDISHMHRLNALSHIAMLGSGPMEAGDRGVVFALNPSAGQYMADKAGKPLTQVAGEFVQNFVDGKATEPKLEDLEPKCRWVMIGLKAACDQANNRGALRPAVLGLEVPSSVLAKKGNVLRFREHGAMFQTPLFELETDVDALRGGRSIVVGWHWVTSLGPAELAEATVFYRLREAAMTAMGTGMSNYSARPGIINFSEGYHWK